MRNENGKLEENYTYNEGGFDALRMAIIVRAIKDYEIALYKKDKYEINNLENFFRGEWYKNICAIDGEYIIEKVRKQVNEKKHKRNDDKRA